MAVTNTGKVQSTSKVIDLSKVQSVFMRPKVTVIINNSNVSTGCRYGADFFGGPSDMNDISGAGQ
jgi:hypothetical protein